MNFTETLKIVRLYHVALFELTASQRVFSFAEAGYLCIPTLLLILKEVPESFAPGDDDAKQTQEGQEDATTVILGVVANIFQKIIELLARRLRKEPEEGKLVRTLLFCCDIFVFILHEPCLFLTSFNSGLF